jgi:hypothetical protein
VAAKWVAMKSTRKASVFVRDFVVLCEIHQMHETRSEIEEFFM